ncbi:MAG: tungsten formylmethanofuran dehydrogenase [Xanthobacteraceae bacterium]|nr:tungsten formylmethanofuran dehydrogenase [Xanthobacteraceae bacterium]
MDRAWIDGKEVSRKAAISEAARLLAASRFPLIAGLGTDIAGARVAIALATRIGAVIDHMHADALLRRLDLMRTAYLMTTTPAEAGLRADCLLLVGSGIGQQSRALLETGTSKRTITWLCPDRAARDVAKGAPTNILGRNPADLPIVLAMLRARIAGRAIGKGPVAAKVIDSTAEELKAARFGVAVWSVEQLDALATEMLQGIVADLNATTRFTSLPIEPPDNAAGVLQVCGWMTGYPMRTRFAPRAPQHDPWMFDPARLVQSGEVDCALWISSYGSAAPEWSSAVPTIALVNSEMRPASPRVAIEVGRPGLDHDCVEFLPAVSALASLPASKPSNAASVARVLTEIAALLPNPGS